MRQFWDPKHLISGTLESIAAQTTSEPKPDPRKRFYWESGDSVRPARGLGESSSAVILAGTGL